MYVDSFARKPTLRETLEVIQFMKGQKIIIEVVIGNSLAKPNMVPHQDLKPGK